MVNVLAVYGSAYGQTEKIVKRIAARVGEQGINVTPKKGDDQIPTAPLDSYDGFLVAASVLGGHHQGYIEEFVRHHAARLRLRPSAFVSVSGSAGSPLAQEKARAQGYVEQFFQATGWRPAVSAIFGGAMAYTKYSFLTRWVIRMISSRRGGPTDMTRDHETTDWAAVDRFADELVHLFQPAVR
jgi:menaquinone-dependent protoporphyrinogen oxidase